MSSPLPDGDLPDYRRILVADVYKQGILAASLTRRQDSTCFTYDPQYLHQGQPPVATTLPLTDQPYITGAGSVPAFFAGLLPEGRRLTALRRAVKTSADDELSLLLAVGEDTPGDVQVVPEGRLPHRSRPRFEFSSTDWFHTVRFRDLLTDSGVIDRVALPGVQDKVSGRIISVPVTVASGDYILKIDPPEFPRVSANEYFFNRIARQAKLRVPDVMVVSDADGHQGLLSSRFDRVVRDSAEGSQGASSGPNGSTSFVAAGFEDACQLLGRWPADKYAVTTIEVAQAIARVCPAAKLALREVLRQFVFAWITGNGDLHSKNIGVLGGVGSEWSIAPSYDIPSTVPYGDTTLALSIEGKTSGLSRRRFGDFAARIGLSERVCDAVIAEVLAGTSDLPDQLAENPFELNDRQLRDLIRTVRHRINSLQ